MGAAEWGATQYIMEWCRGRLGKSGEGVGVLEAVPTSPKTHVQVGGDASARPKAPRQHHTPCCDVSPQSLILHPAHARVAQHNTQQNYAAKGPLVCRPGITTHFFFPFPYLGFDERREARRAKLEASSPFLRRARRSSSHPQQPVPHAAAAAAQDCPVAWACRLFFLSLSPPPLPPPHT